MVKINKILLGSTFVLAVLVIATFGQTYFRNRQIETLRTEIKDRIAAANLPEEAVAIIQDYEDKIVYAYDHKPLLNLNIGLSSSFAGQQQELCGQLYTVMTKNTVVLNSLEEANLEAASKDRTRQQAQDIQQAAKGLFLISGCSI